MTKRVIDKDGRMEPISCKVVEREPTVSWIKSSRTSRLNRLSLASKSYLSRSYTLYFLAKIG